MTKSRTVLRICDAYGNRRNVLTLDETFYEIGADRARRGEPGYLHLEGSGVEARHARLQRHPVENRWQVTALVAKGAKLGRQDLSLNEASDLSDGN